MKSKLQLLLKRLGLVSMAVLLIASNFFQIISSLLEASASPVYATGLAIDKTVTKHQSSGATSITSPSFSTTQAGELLEVFLMADGPNPGTSSFSSVTGASLVWTLRQRVNTQAGDSEIWQAWAPNVLANVTVKATRASGSYNGSMVIVAFTGAAQSQTGATAAGNAANGAPNVTLTTTTNGSWVFGVGNDWDSATARTLGSGQTMVDQYMSNTGDDFWVQRQTSTTATAGTLVSINDTAPTNDRWNLAALEVVPAVAADTQAPSAPTNLVANATAPNQVGLTWNASTDNVGVTGYKVFRNGTQIGTSSSTSYTDNNVSPSTSYTYDVFAYDAAGNVSATSNDALVTTPADTTAPSVSITAPANGAVVAGAISITANASDNVGVAAVQFQVDGVNLGAASTTVPYSVSWNTTTAADGLHNLTAVASDAAGNVTTSTTVSVSVMNHDNVAPTVAITAPASGATVSGTLGVTASASDNVGVVGVQFQVDGANLGSEDTTSPYSVSWNTTGVANGAHNLTAIARDASGNTTTSSAVSVTVNNDVTAPTVSITVPSNGASLSGTTTVSANASDDVGVVGVQFKLDGVNLGTEDTTSPYSISWNTITASNGSHTLTAVARDAAGNSTTSSPITVTVNNSAPTVTATVTGSSVNQKIDGFGVNAIPKTWQGGALKPAIDALVNSGATAWRVDVDNAHSDWEYFNDNSDPFTFDWNYYDSLYGGPQFADLWNELAYLNSKGVTNIEMSMSGLVPLWMSTSNDGHTINSTKEDEFVEEVTSILYYARNVKGIRFTSVSPLNETDKTSPEGPTVGAAQMAEIFGKLATRLDQIGLKDVQIIGPHTSSFDTTYTNAIMGNAAAMSHIKAFSYHSYGTSDNAPSSADFSLGNIKNSAYPDREVYVGEWNQCYTVGCPEGTENVGNEWSFAREMTDELLNHLDAGASEVQAWDAWNSWHEHDTCCSYSGWGELAQDNNGIWNTKKRLYSNAQVWKFVAPGMSEVSSSIGSSNFDFVAFKNSATGQVTVVGHNRGTSAANLQISMSGMPNVASLSYYQTNSTDNMAQGANVMVSGGSMGFMVPADTVFTVSNVTNVIDPVNAGPYISSLNVSQVTSNSAVVNWTTDAPSTSQVFFGTTGSYGSATTLDSSLVTNHSVTLNGLSADVMYHLQVRSGSSTGIVNASSDNNFTTLLSNGNQSLAVDNQVSSYDIRSNSTILIPAYSTSQGNELLELFVSSNGGLGEAVSSVTGGGLTWTRRAQSHGQNGTSEIWQAVAPSALNNATITVTMNQNTLTAVTLVSFIGARTDVNGAAATAGAGSGASSVTVNTQYAGSWVWGVGNDWTNNIPRTLGAGQTLQYQLPSYTTGNTFWAQSNDNQSHVAGTPITLNDTAPTSDVWNMAAIEIVPSFNVPDTQAPTAPSNLAAVANSSNQVGLTWTASTDNVGVTGYNVLRDGVQIGTTTNTSFTDNSVSPNVTYNYTVTARDAAGNVSAASNTATVTTPADTTAPVLSNIAASNISATSANINWTTDEPATSQVNYGLTSGYGSASALDGSYVTSHAQSLTGLAPSTTYHYQVVSVDSSGNIATSGDFTFITSASQALAVDTQLSVHQSTAANSISSSTFSISQANELIVAFLTSDGSNSSGAQSFSAVSGGGLSWTLKARANAQPGTAEIWQAVAPSALSNVSITATRASGSYTGSMTVVAFKGANLVTNGATKTASATSGAPSIALVTTANGSWVWGVGDDWDSATARTTGPNQTLVDQYLAPAGDTFWTQRQNSTTLTAGTTVTINDIAPTADRWNMSAIEILPAN